MSRVRVLLAKPGLDGHDRGVKVVAMALRDAGAEVIYLGQRRTVPQILEAAEQEDVDVIGLSILSGAHMPITEQLLQQRADRTLDVPIVIGGTIPPADAELLRGSGVEAVFPSGSDLGELVDFVLGLAGRRPSA